MLPSPDILNEFEHGKFVLSNLAAKRAKQLKEGAPPLIRIESSHPLTIALAEIAAGKIKAIVPTASELAPSEEGTLLLEETVPAELGMLLPALDEAEAALVGSVALVGDDEHDAEVDHETEAEVMSLSDLVADEEEEEPTTPIAEDDTLSLSVIAEQESSEEEEPEE